MAIDWKTIISEFDGKPTLLQAIGKLRKAVEDETITIQQAQAEIAKLESQLKADEALITKAQSTADEAKINAYNASQKGDQALGKATTADTKAQNAQSAAQAADTKAQQALDLATTNETDIGTLNGQVAELKQNSITGIGVSYIEGYNATELGTFKRMQYPKGYGQPIDDGNTYIVPLPELKKLFGNQSLFGEGNIDLYKHHVALTLGNNKFYIDFISSNDLFVESLLDLKQILGNTFQIACYGFIESGGTRSYAQYADENAIYYGTGTNSLSWSDFTITDTVTTI